MDRPVAEFGPDELLVRAKARVLQEEAIDMEIASPWYARIDIYPHQLDTAVFAARSQDCRVLLADEVGLGKTIEAGLIIKELILRGKCSRAILITPASLVSQWEAELHSKFSIDVQRIDSSDMGLLKGDDHGVFLVSIDLAKRKLDLFETLSWDLALFDEAHHLRQRLVSGKSRRATLKYKLGKIVAERSKSLVLLTATPMQLNYFEFYSLVELLDPLLFRDFETFMKYVEYVLQDLRFLLGSAEKLDYEQCQRAGELLGILGSIFPDRIEPITNNRSIPCESLVKGLREFDYLAQVMIRHRKREEFPDLKPRTVQTYAVSYSTEEMGVYTRISRFIRDEYARARDEKNRGAAFLLVTYQQLLSSSPSALLAALRKRYGNLSRESPAKTQEFGLPEEDDIVEDFDTSVLHGPGIENEREATNEFIQELTNLKDDSKLKALRALVEEILVERSSEKIVVFTRFIETQKHIREALSSEFKVTVYNGQLSLEEKDQAIEEFRSNAQIMISTEAGGEGRNLQFCHIMVNYDLPWNPVRLEQRIGRIDRIGQKNPVIVTNLASYDTIEQRIFESLTARITAFENLIGPVDPILGSIEEDIEEIMMTREELLEPVKTFEERFDGKVSESSIAHSNLSRLVFNSPGSKNRMENLEGTIKRIQEEDMEKFLFDALRQVPGSKIEMVKPHVYRIKSGLFDRYYAAEEPSWTGTTYRQIALDNPKIDFFTRDHPLVVALLEALRLPEGIAISCQARRGERPSAMIGLEYDSLEVDTRRMACIRYTTGPEIVKPRDFLSMTAREKVACGNPVQLLDSAMIRQAMAASVSYVKERFGTSGDPPQVKFMILTNPNEWRKDDSPQP